MKTLKQYLRLEDAAEFIYKAAKAKADGEDEFEIGGKTYPVTIDDEDEILDEAKLNEAGLARIYDKMQKHATGTITAFRGEFSRRENMTKNSELKQELLRLGFSVTAIEGSYIENFGSADEVEVAEKSFFVANHNVEGDDRGELERALIRMGKKFDQDSVMIVPVGGKNAYLVGTSIRDNAWPEYGQKEVVGSGRLGQHSGMFLSRIRGRAFAFESKDL